MTLLLAALIAARGGVDWKSDYAAALAEAKASGKYVQVHVTGSGCPWCVKMDAETLSDAATTAWLNATFVNVKVDQDRNPELARTLRWNAIPTTVLVAPDGARAGGWEGYLPVAKFRASLENGLKAHRLLAGRGGKPDDAESAGAYADLGDVARAAKIAREVAPKIEDLQVRGAFWVRAVDWVNEQEPSPEVDAALLAAADDLEKADADGARGWRDDAAFARAMADVNREKLDDAMAKLAALEEAFPKSERTPAAMLALANLAHHYKEDHARALKILDRVGERFPGTEHAAMAKEFRKHVEAHAGQAK